MKKLVFLLVASSLSLAIVSCEQSKKSKSQQNPDKTDCVEAKEVEAKEVVEAPLALVTPVDSVSYLVGVNFGAQLKGWNAADNLDELNLIAIRNGIIDFLDAKGTPNPYDSTFTSQFKIDLKLMDRILGDYINKRVADKNEHAKKAADAFLAEDAKKDDVTTTESGLQYTIIEEGSATKIRPEDTVKVNYKGCLVDGTVFDENQGIEFVANQVIRGWTEGLGLIGEGGKIKLYIPSDLGYGDRDLPNIPANSVLVFDVEVVEVK